MDLVCNFLYFIYLPFFGSILLLEEMAKKAPSVLCLSFLGALKKKEKKRKHVSKAKITKINVKRIDLKYKGKNK